jgi:succinylglutamic semialdehyde dehydrogenase
MAAQLKPLTPKGDFIGGSFVPVAAPDDEIVKVSPRDFADTLGRVPFWLGAVDGAVAAAPAAFPAWSMRPLEERKQLLLVLKERLAAHAGELALCITREIGKPLWEARTEVQAALNKIDVTLHDGLSLVAPREMAGSKQRYAFRPLGVGAVLGPFNFPLHLVHGHVVPALVTGNTVVVKPSELAPFTADLYAQCFAEAGFPPGVFSLVQGDGQSGARLSAHPDVDLVMFTGSYAVGQAIKRATLDQPHKLLALELGGHNPALVLADAPLEKAVHDVLWGAFVSAGQRCSGTAVALVEEAVADAFEARLLTELARVRVGDPLEPDVFLGPLVSEQARERTLAALGAAEAEPSIRTLRPAQALGGLHGAYVTTSVHRIEQARGLPYEEEELFGPDLAIERVQSLDHALVRANAGGYGLAASVFTVDREKFGHAFARLRHGCVNWNAPTCGASSRLPFGGTGKSGNHRPAALFSTLYATYPVATLEGGLELDRASLSPGLHFGGD